MTSANGGSDPMAVAIPETGTSSLLSDDFVLAGAALAYARHGVPVFPVARRGKAPAISKAAGGHGYLDATTDLDVVRKRWTDYAGSNIGMPTGRASGLVVVDIDPRHDGSLDDLPVEARETEAWVSTPGGGWHLYFRAPLHELTGNKLGPGIDLKHRGGYVLLPPSVRTVGAYFRLRAGQAADWPACLDDLLASRKGRRRHEEPRRGLTPGGSDRVAYAREALHRETAKIRATPAGSGACNNQLNRSAFALFRLEIVAVLGRDHIWDRLEVAALEAGEEPSKITSTLTSAATARGVVVPVCPDWKDSDD